MARVEDSSAEIANAQEKFKSCPEFKRYLWDCMLKDVKAQRRTSVKLAMESARRKDWVRTDGDPFKVNNNLAPAIARLFLLEHPEARPYIETRRAGCDGMERFA